MIFKLQSTFISWFSAPGLALLMVSVRFKKRGLPLLCCAKETQGGIGFEEQKELLEKIIEWIPQGHSIMLAGDRFYGSQKLIQWCQDNQWHYRLRLRSNLMVYHPQGPEKSLATLFSEGIDSLEDVSFVTGARTSVGIIHEKGHKEP